MRRYTKHLRTTTGQKNADDDVDHDEPTWKRVIYTLRGQAGGRDGGAPRSRSRGGRGLAEKIIIQKKKRKKNE